MNMFLLQKSYFLKFYLKVSLLGYAKKIKSTREKKKKNYPNYFNGTLMLNSKIPFKYSNYFK